MKKLMVLMLVLVMTSLAGAGSISYLPSSTTIQGSEIVSMTVSGSGFDADGLIDIVLIDTLVTSLTGDVGSFTISNLAADAAWDFPAGTNVTIPDTDLQVTPPGSVSSVGPTTLFTFDLSLSGSELVGDSITFGATSVVSIVASTFTDFTNNISSVDGTVTVIPEPITFGLLGLGGLFLRRRKK
ncbi:MAG: PEP-CTERM sorting domain-containing protein [Planctomycetota bacterium]